MLIHNFLKNMPSNPLTKQSAIINSGLKAFFIIIICLNFIAFTLLNRQMSTAYTHTYSTSYKLFALCLCLFVARQTYLCYDDIE